MALSQSILSEDYKLAADTGGTPLLHIPGDTGLPFFGQSFRMLKNFQGFLQDQYRRYGAVSRTRFGRQYGVLLLGPDHSQSVLIDRERNFSSQMGYERNMSPFFGGGLMLRDFDEHRIHRRIMQTAFKTDTLRTYLQSMNSILAQGIDSWKGMENFYFYTEIKELLLQVAAKIFIGVDIGRNREFHQMNQAFLNAVAALNNLIPLNVPGFAYYRGRKGRRYLYQYFSAMLAEKRQGEGNDMFCHFACERDENGELYSDDDVIRHIIFMMMAAHDTTTSALSSCMSALITYPEWQEKIRNECLAWPNEYLEYGDLDQLPNLDSFMHEVLRMYSPVPMIMRRTVRDLDFDGYSLPAHTIVAVAPSFSHRMEEWWDDPESFDPQRFSAERNEHKRHKFNYIPFGGGAHKCIGLHFAMMQIKCFLHQLLRRYRFELPADAAMPIPYQEVPFPHPKNRLPLIVRDL